MFYNLGVIIKRMIVGVIQLIDSHFNFTAIAGKTLWFIERIMRTIYLFLPYELMISPYLFSHFFFIYSCDALV